MRTDRRSASRTDPAELAGQIGAIRARAAGTDAERRTARLLARELKARGRAVTTETFWVRPYWGLVHAAAAIAGVAGSVASVDHQRVALGLLLGALVVLGGDAAGRMTLLRRLTPARATQNVVAPSPRDAQVRLVITAAVDVPRTGMLARPPFDGRSARLRRALHGALPGPHGTAVLALLALIALTAVRASGTGGTALGAAQLIPTVVLLLTAAAFVDAAVARPAATAPASARAVAVAIALADALDAAPPRRLAADLVLAGAGETAAQGMRHEVRRRRAAGARPQDVVVLHVAPGVAETPVWWTREGLLIPLGYHPALLAACREVARAERHIGARSHESPTVSGASVAREARWPAIAVGCGSIEATLELCMALVARLDARLGDSGVATPATGTPSA